MIRALRSLLGLWLGVGVCCAAFGGPTEDARRALQQSRVPVDASALVQYAALGDLATVELLLRAGVPADAAEPKRQVRALHNAAAEGRSRVLTRLLEEAVDVDAVDQWGRTPLLNAVWGGHVELARQLHARGARLDRALPDSGWRAWDLAVLRQDVRMAAFLTQTGAVPTQDTIDLARRLDRAALLPRSP